MKEEIAKLVDPVISYGLQLRARVMNGEDLDLYTEQQVIKGKLLSEMEASRNVDFGGDSRGSSGESITMSRSLVPGGRGSGREAFLGIRYALACWLDEIFIDNTPWSVSWDNLKIETQLYGSNDRAWNFWQQAERAEARPGGDALEVFFLCVMLGFRGERRGNIDDLQTWVSKIQARLSRSAGGEWPVPPELDPQIYVPPLHGRERMERMFLIGGIAFLVMIPALAFVLIRYLT
jgi:type VI secretion system protein ImpK